LQRMGAARSNVDLVEVSVRASSRCENGVLEGEVVKVESRLVMAGRAES